MAETAKRLCLYLANSFASNLEDIPNLFKGMRIAVIETEPHPNNLLLPRWKRI